MEPLKYRRDIALIKLKLVYQEKFSNMVIEITVHGWKKVEIINKTIVSINYQARILMLQFQPLVRGCIVNLHI